MLTLFYLLPVSEVMSNPCSLATCFILWIIPLERVIYGGNNHPFSPVMCPGSGTRKSGYWSSFCWAHLWWDLWAPCLIHLLPAVEIYLCKVLIALTVCQWRQTTSPRLEITATVLTSSRGSGVDEKHFATLFVTILTAGVLRQETSEHIHRISKKSSCSVTIREDEKQEASERRWKEAGGGRAVTCTQRGRQDDAAGWTLCLPAVCRDTWGLFTLSKCW